jgi:hypothetical protein
MVVILVAKRRAGKKEGEMRVVGDELMEAVRQLVEYMSLGLEAV